MLSKNVMVVEKWKEKKSACGRGLLVEGKGGEGSECCSTKKTRLFTVKIVKNR